MERRRPGSLPLAPELVEALCLPHFALTITARCQQRCGFCFEGRRGRRPDMPFDEACSMLLRARRSVGAVVLMGAESTLHPRFLDIVAHGAGLGLRMGVSTNLRRFADRAFLERALGAGLCAVELPLHYPDAAVFSAVTGSPPERFGRYLEALGNLAELGGPEGAVFVNANVVLHASAVGRLGELLALGERLLGGAFRVVTLKRLETLAPGGAPCCEQGWVLPGEELRGLLVELLGSWPSATVTPVLRDLPLCLAPGWEHLHADLLLRVLGSDLRQNFGGLPEYSPMHPRAEAGEARPGGCEGCEVAGACRDVTRGRYAAACPGLRPEPVRERLGELLERAGVSARLGAEYAGGAGAQRLTGEGGLGASSAGSLQLERSRPAIARVLESFISRDGRARLVAVDRVERDDLGPSLRIALNDEEGPFELFVGQRREGRRAWLVGRSLVLAHPAGAQLGRRRAALARVILGCCERVVVRSHEQGTLAKE